MFLNHEIVYEPILHDQLVGVMCRPKHHPSTPLPAILVLGGGAGHSSLFRAELLARSGFIAVALSYFGEGSLPPLLQEIPLEYFQTAMGWLSSHPLVDPHRLGLWGISRGAELALILASFFPLHILSQLP